MRSREEIAYQAAQILHPIRHLMEPSPGKLKSIALSYSFAPRFRWLVMRAMSSSTRNPPLGEPTGPRGEISQLFGRPPANPSRAISAASPDAASRKMLHFRSGLSQYGYLALPGATPWRRFPRIWFPEQSSVRVVHPNGAAKYGHTSGIRHAGVS